MSIKFGFSKSEIKCTNGIVGRPLFPLSKFDEKELLKLNVNYLSLEAGKSIVNILNKSSYGYTRTRAREVARALKTIHQKTTRTPLTKEIMPVLIAGYEDQVLEFYKILRGREFDVSTRPLCNKRTMGLMIYSLSLNEALVSHFFLDLLGNVERFKWINKMINSIQSKSPVRDLEALENCEALIALSIISLSSNKSVDSRSMHAFVKGLVNEEYNSGLIGEWSFSIRASLLNHFS